MEIHNILLLALFLVMVFYLVDGYEPRDVSARPEQDELELSEMFHGLVEDYDEVEHELTTDY